MSSLTSLARLFLTPVLSSIIPSQERVLQIADTLSWQHQGLLPVIEGGSPFSFCEQSRSTDLYNISMMHLNPQPVHLSVYIYKKILCRDILTSQGIECSASIFMVSKPSYIVYNIPRQKYWSCRYLLEEHHSQRHLRRSSRLRQPLQRLRHQRHRKHNRKVAILHGPRRYYPTGQDQWVSACRGVCIDNHRLWGHAVVSCTSRFLLHTSQPLLTKQRVGTILPLTPRRARVNASIA
jgi:hypothetical protein